MFVLDMYIIKDKKSQFKFNIDYSLSFLPWSLTLFTKKKLEIRPISMTIIWRGNDYQKGKGLSTSGSLHPCLTDKNLVTWPLQPMRGAETNCVFGCCCLFNRMYFLGEKNQQQWCKDGKRRHFGRQQAHSASEAHLSICSYRSGIFIIFSLSLVFLILKTVHPWVHFFVWILLRV